ncbi:hypothetical protein NRIC_29800 [Enterococcus florum]|uniref:Sigma-54 factor interaction domain-containing protein n=1 Tax=Enterococcus florum TaxID=2480627 RepID=A0A4V0WPU6_9ENTE|nr:sigma-54-dependent Fis family transcriptional regulator [Enterococcus florum]GCF95089.1 hypothetical protein NRIC_29800 [Enterococcus florum]
MVKKISVLGIAPYEELNHSMHVVSEQFADIQTDIYTADLEEGQRLAIEHFNQGYDVIISRGGTADLIREVVAIPVIDVSISIYDILGAIRLAENYTDNFAVVGYSSITEMAHLLCDILGYKIKIITLTDTVDAGKTLDALAEEHYEMILCDAITNRLALTRSLNTILITSGFESIKHAFQEALTIAKYLKQAKHEYHVLAQSMSHQRPDRLILDEHFQIQFSTLSSPLEQAILSFLQTKKRTEEESHYYTTIRGKAYSIELNRLIVDERHYFNCTINASTPPIVGSRLGVLYQKKAEVEEAFTTKLLFSKFIQASTKQELQKLAQYYQAMIVFGETGTAKSSIAYQAYLVQKTHTNYLISIDSKLINDKLWKFLVNPGNGPLVDINNTILFEHVEQLSLQDIDRLITIIKNTRLLQRNHVIFTYDTNHAADKLIYDRLLTELNCASIYAPSLKERKNELSVITTLLLNKMNIECNKEIMGFDPTAIKDFLAFDWPGNLNQLQAAIKELVIHAATHYITEHQVSELLKKERMIQSFSTINQTPMTLQHTAEQPTLFDYSKQIILNVLEQNNGNQTKTAEQLGISRTTLWRYLKDD